VPVMNNSVSEYLTALREFDDAHAHWRSLHATIIAPKLSMTATGAFAGEVTDAEARAYDAARKRLMLAVQAVEQRLDSVWRHSSIADGQRL
jgi:hypothetical protein